MTSLIHPTAIIDSSAQIGENVKIGPNVFIGENVIIHDNVEIKPFSYLEFCEIGKNTIIHNGVSIGTPPQDLGYKNEPSKAVVGENCQIREQVTIHRSAKENGVTTVGNDCLLMAASHVAHDCKVGDKVIMANVAILGGHVTVERGAFIGGVSAVHQGVRVGEMCIMSGYSATRRDVPPYSKTDADMGILSGLNIIGLRRNGLSAEERAEIKQAYKYIWYSHLNRSQGVAKAKENCNMENKYVKHLIEFIETSTKGVITTRK